MNKISDHANRWVQEISPIKLSVMVAEFVKTHPDEWAEFVEEAYSEHCAQHAE